MILASKIMTDNKFKECVIGTLQRESLLSLLSNLMYNVLDKKLNAKGVHFINMYMTVLS